jgi:hypothetical protein
METIEYTRIICDVWTYWQKRYPDVIWTMDDSDIYTAYKRDMSYILYRITGDKWFITKSDSDVINTIIDRLLGVGSDFGYGTGLSETGKVIGKVMGDTINFPKYERPPPQPVRSYGELPEMYEKWEDRDKYKQDMMIWNNASAKYRADFMRWYDMKERYRYKMASTNLASTCLDLSCEAMGYYIGGKIGAKIGEYTKISSDEYIYDMTDTTEMNNPDFTFDKLIEIFKPYLKVKRNLLPPFEYIYYVFDLILRWSDFDAIKSRFVLFGELYIDPILHRIANPSKPVYQATTLRELSYDTANKNYSYKDIISKIGEEAYSQAAYNFRDVYDEARKAKET